MSATRGARRRANRAKAGTHRAELKVKRGARKASAEIKRDARKASRTTREVVLDERVTRLARVGYVARGGLYGVMGALAIALALGEPVSTTDQRGLLSQVGTGPIALGLLTVATVALLAYALWGFARAVYDPLHRGSDPPGIAARIGFAWSGLNYTLLCLFAAGFIAGRTRNADPDSVPHTVARAMALPAGRIVVVAAGAIGLVGGLGQFVEAFRAGFRRDVKRTRMTAAERAANDSLGRAGMVARGVIFTLLAWFIFVAGITGNPGRAEGMGQTFTALEAAPYGRVLLALVGSGFVALGVHSVLNARWVRSPRQH